jgi:chromosome segregation ATPase
MLSPGTLTILLVFGLPIVAVVAWAYVKQLQISAESGPPDTVQKLQSDVSSLQDEVSTLRDERGELQRRIQNLETIVTNEVWDDERLRPARTGTRETEHVESEEEDARTSDPKIESGHSSPSLDLPDDVRDDDSDAKNRATRLAERLRRSS